MATELDMERVLLLKRVALFRDLPMDTLLAVSRVLESRQYLAGATILEAGTCWDHFCIVESGAVDLFAHGRAAERLIAPAYFGELILVDDRVRSPRVVAACDCVLLRLHRIVFQDLSRELPRHADGAVQAAGGPLERSGRWGGLVWSGHQRPKYARLSSTPGEFDAFMAQISESGRPSPTTPRTSSARSSCRR